MTVRHKVIMAKARERFKKSLDLVYKKNHIDASLLTR